FEISLSPDPGRRVERAARDEDDGDVRGGVVFEDKAFARGKVTACGDDVVEEDDVCSRVLRAVQPDVIVHQFVDGGAFVFVAFVCGDPVFAADDRFADI